MTKLSVNINKVATLRNARGGNNPDVVKVALDCEAFGAEGITVHPRPDERHIRRSDVYELRPLLTTEFNIEGYPSPEFVDLVLKVKPHQVTLVPDAPDQITSNAGWDTKTNLSFLTELMDTFGQAGISTSIFVGTDKEMIEYAAKAGADRVEIYTEPYATMYPRNPEAAIAPFIEAAKVTRSLGMGLHARLPLREAELHSLQALPCRLRLPLFCQHHLSAHPVMLSWTLGWHYNNRLR